MSKSNAIDPAFGIYIHWPFCAKKCPYCDFNSHVRNAIDHDVWLQAYRQELTHYAKETSDKTVTSVFFGGGTPSLMKPAVIETILNDISKLWTCSSEIEINAEANPSSSEIQLFQDFKQAGINRLSIGVQSFDDKNLQFLGRLHSANEAEQAIQAADKTFSRYSFDLIYALPDQTVAEWHTELEYALKMAGNHLSLYQLTIEPGTEFHKTRVPAADEDIGSELFEFTQEIMNDAGFPAYEISNHAQPGEECRHNLVYWRGQSYLGIGPGAHGRLNHADSTEMIHNYREPEKWLELALNQQTGVQKRTDLSPDERKDEIILMALRLTEGLSSRHFRVLTGLNLWECFKSGRLQTLENEGFIQTSGERLRVTKDGRQRLNAVLAYLLT